MRLHSLAMTAIGPFAGTEQVDFDALAIDGLFLFTGPTGSGKSTVLDAVTYALYGALPGTRGGQVAKLKSDHVAPAVRPEVVLECTIGEERIRITRSPAYQRPAKRGGGLTEERAAVFLERFIEGRWVGVEGGRREAPVQDWLRERLGLSADQFAQVVLLPQGQFAHFLHSTDTDREKVLRTLFRADRFTAVEDWLHERHKHAAEQARMTGEALDRLKDRLKDVTGLTDDDVPELPTEDWFDHIVTARRERLAAERAAADVSAARVTERHDRLAGARRVIELQAARESARQRLHRIEAQAAAIEQTRARLDAGRRAAAVAGLIDLMDDAAARRADAERRVVVARAGLVIPGCPTVPEDGGELRAARDRLVEDRAALAAALTAEVNLRSLIDVADDLERDAEAAAGRLAGWRRDLSEFPGRLSEARDEVAALSLRAGRLRDAEADEQRRRSAYDAAVRVAALEPELGAAEEQLRLAIDAAQDARETYLDVQERRIASMAGELAAALTPGEPCAVCGSAAHPRPATAAPDAPTPQSIAAARRAADRADIARQEALSERGALAEQIAASRAAAGGQTEAAARRALDDACAATADATDAERALREVENRITDLQDRYDEASGQVEAGAAAAAEAGQAHRAARAAVQRCWDEVATALDGHATVAARAATLDESIAVLNDLVDLTAAAAEASRADTERADAARQCAVEHGFADVTEARAAILTVEQLDELAATLTRYDAERAAVEEAVAQADVTGLTDVPPDLPGLQAAVAEATAADRAAGAAVARSIQVLDELATLQTRVLEQIVELSDRERDAVRVRDLALVVRGQGANEKRMSLTSYYLSARLEQVTEIASDHLRRMTADRYTLLHTDQRVTRRGHGGLGLIVLDAHTGVTRSPRTLSGGETFAASLALALALAEVVTSEAGGIAIDSLFIDEGFGALDPRYLDDAMGVLDDLRAVGRTIGVVSHVEELRQRIPSQLVIERAETGSRIVGSESRPTAAYPEADPRAASTG